MTVSSCNIYAPIRLQEGSPKPFPKPFQVNSCSQSQNPLHPVPVLSLHDKLRIPTRTKLENSSAAVRHLVDQGRRDDDKESQVAEVGCGEGASNLRHARPPGDQHRPQASRRPRGTGPPGPNRQHGECDTRSVRSGCCARNMYTAHLLMTLPLPPQGAYRGCGPSRSHRAAW